MNNPYELHTWSRHHREEMLREVDRRRLEGQLRAKDKVGDFGVRARFMVLGARRVALAMAIAVVIAASAFFSVPAFASHEHYLLTPGTCVEDVARGQTSKAENEGGYHKFHDNVHKGQPGTAAFENPNNPVTVDKGPCPTRH